MERAAKWRGDPEASNKREFLRVLSYVNPSKKDVFFDLGCGYAGPCIWIAPKVKLAIGVESHYHRYLHAGHKVASSGFKNIKILWDDIDEVSFQHGTIFYTVIYVGFDIVKKIDRQTRSGTQFIFYGLPPYPLKSERLFGRFFRLQTPFQRVEDEDEFARIYLGNARDSSIMKLMKSLDREQARDLKKEIKQADSNWRSLTRGR